MNMLAPVFFFLGYNFYCTTFWLAAVLGVLLSIDLVYINYIHERTRACATEILWHINL